MKIGQYAAEKASHHEDEDEHPRRLWLRLCWYQPAVQRLAPPLPDMSFLTCCEAAAATAVASRHTRCRHDNEPPDPRNEGLMKIKTNTRAGGDNPLYH
ncbi:hypothetical protein [Nannocystis bainbridge]|uniref:Uncharacterized protein n=1 Tax=Nannocystis bainbridge TaxID=2995303 RepID=A0ABT5DVJ6_9BACT|nr:hypothetical protein [Nannocystis bainbridge]MDC0717606.1 hypothetical protein [Nannocystis bainbridge]